jgi:Cof subfamily protein (haloacid dehalogenase superfamily)
MTDPVDPHLSVLPAIPDLRLVVTDMDGTLLDGEGRIPDELWPLVEELDERGIVFSVASGRQYLRLRRQFERICDRAALIAENGTMVVHRDEIVGTAPMELADAHRLVTLCRELNADGSDLSPVICCQGATFLERGKSPEFLAEIQAYYEVSVVVDDLLDVVDVPLKCAVYDRLDAQAGSAPLLRAALAPNHVSFSAAHWLDIMAPGAHKGTAVRNLQRALGVTPAQTAVFGDFLNDLEMMGEAEHSFAMANAHPELIAVARYIAPPHTENGVVRTLQHLLS